MYAWPGIVNLKRGQKVLVFSAVVFIFHELFSRAPWPSEVQFICNYKSNLTIYLTFYFALAQVSFPNQVQRKVDALLKEFAFRKKQSQMSASEYGSLDGDSGSDIIDDEVELAQKAGTRDMLPGMASAVQELQSRRSRQIRNKQRSWQESEEGRKMTEFRKTLPAQKEREALLAAIARNQVTLDL